MQYTCDTDINGIPYAYINIILIEDEIKYTFQKDKTFFEFAVSQQIHVQLNCVEIEFIPTMTPSPATVKFHQVQLSGQQLTVTSPVCVSVHLAGGGGGQTEAAPGSPPRFRPLLSTLSLQ